MPEYVDQSHFTNYKPPPFAGMNGNFMTPNIHGYVDLGDGRYAELSSNDVGFGREYWGVSVRPESDERLSRLCDSRKSAEAYIDELVAG